MAGYIAQTRLHMGDGLYREFGEPVPEADGWSNKRSYEAAGQILRVSDREYDEALAAFKQKQRAAEDARQAEHARLAEARRQADEERARLAYLAELEAEAAVFRAQEEARIAAEAEAHRQADERARLEAEALAVSDGAGPAEPAVEATDEAAAAPDAPAEEPAVEEPAAETPTEEPTAEVTSTTKRRRARG